MSFLEILGAIWIGLIASTILSKIFLKKDETEDEEAADLSRRNMLKPQITNFVVDVEYIPEHKTFYAYMQETGKFVTQASSPEELGTKIGKIMPMNATIVINSIKEVGRFKEQNGI